MLMLQWPLHSRWSFRWILCCTAFQKGFWWGNILSFFYSKQRRKYSFCFSAAALPSPSTQPGCQRAPQNAWQASCSDVLQEEFSITFDCSSQLFLKLIFLGLPNYIFAFNLAEFMILFIFFIWIQLLLFEWCLLNSNKLFYIPNL